MKNYFKINAEKILICLLCVYSCQNSKNDKSSFYSFNFEKSLVVNLPHEYFVHSTMDIQCYEREDTIFSMIANFEKHQILEIDLSNARLNRTINLEFLKNDIYPVFSFRYLDRDKIFIIRDEANVSGNHEKSFIFINGKGEVTGFLDVTKSDFSRKGKSNSIKTYSFVHDFLPLVVSENQKLFIFPWSNSFSRTKNDSLIKYGIPFLGYFNLNKQEVDHFNILPYVNPEPTDHFFAKSQQSIHAVAISSNELIIAYAYQSHPHKYIISEDLYIFPDFVDDYALISNPKPLEIGEEIERRLNPKSSRFRSVLNDQFNKKIIRFATIPLQNIEADIPFKSLLEFQRRHQFFAVYDYDLSFLGEGKKPENFITSQPNPGFINGEFISMAQENDSSIRFEFYGLSESKVSSAFIDSIRTFWEEDVLHITKKTTSIEKLLLDLKIESGSIVIFIPPIGCPQCIKNTIEYFAINIENLNKINAYLLVSENEKGLFKGNSNFFRIDAEDNGRVIKLDEKLLKEAISFNTSNPQFLFWENGEIKKIYTLTAQDTENISKVIQQIIDTLNTNSEKL